MHSAERSNQAAPQAITPVILSGAAASQSQAAAESKDLYLSLIYSSLPFFTEPLAAFPDQTLSLKLRIRRQRSFDSALAFVNESKTALRMTDAWGFEVLNPQ